MSNFDFLIDYDNDLYKLGNKIEENVNTSPAAVKTYATPFLEHVLKLLLEKIGRNYNSRKDFYYQLDAVYREGKINYSFKQKIYGAYQLRNKIHDNIEEMERSEYLIAQQLHKNLYNISKKMYRDFAPAYDPFIGVPEFKPIAVEKSSPELELIEIPDFSEVIEINYDYCIICGEPNHSNYSLCCEKCNRVMDNANNFITIRNAFGSDAKLTKEDLIEYGIPEGYVNQLVNSMVRENMLDVKGRYITFNDMYLERYLAKIDNYIAVCELITKFREDKITAGEVKNTREYRLGSRKEPPFYQFYKITNREIIKKFENDLVTTKDIWNSIDYTTITESQLERWYKRELGHYRRGKRNSPFIMFNDLLIAEYLDMKRCGELESDIKKKLNITDEIYEFWLVYDRKFTSKIKEINIELLSDAITSGKTKAEVIEYAGVTQREYEDLIKVADFNDTEFSRLRKRELESRKREFTKYLFNYDLYIACRKAKITLDDFYDYYEEYDIESEFYKKSTRILMDKYLSERKRGKTKKEAIENVKIKPEYYSRWSKRSAYAEFRDAEMAVVVELILKGLKKNQSLEEISEIADVGVGSIKSYIQLGKRGSSTFRPLSDYYENVIIPEKLSTFLKANDKKPLRKALEATGMKYDEVDRYYQLGQNGDEKYVSFYETFFEIKKRNYVYYISKGKSHKIAMRESHLTDDEFSSSQKDLDELLRLLRFKIVIEAISNNKTSNVAASRANCSVDDIYEWYFRGRDGDEDYVDFYEGFHKGYVKPSIVPIQKELDTKNVSIDNLIRSNKQLFTKSDFEIWMEHGLINVGVFQLEDEKQDEKDDDDDNKNDVMEVNIKSRFSRQKRRSTLGRIDDRDYDIEKLKKEILK